MEPIDDDAAGRSDLDIEDAVNEDLNALDAPKKSAGDQYQKVGGRCLEMVYEREAC